MVAVVQQYPAVLALADGGQEIRAESDGQADDGADRHAGNGSRR